MNFTQVKLTTTIPREDASKLREALGKAGAGTIGDYTYCSFSIVGTGRFMPNDNADPHIGEANKLTSVEEEQVTVTCARSQAKQIIAALRAIHPYEEPIIEITPLIDEEDI